MSHVIFPHLYNVVNQQFIKQGRWGRKGMFDQVKQDVRWGVRLARQYDRWFYDPKQLGYRPVSHHVNKLPCLQVKAMPCLTVKSKMVHVKSWLGISYWIKQLVVRHHSNKHYKERMVTSYENDPNSSLPWLYLEDEL